MLHVIFSASYELNDCMLDRAVFKSRIDELSKQNPRIDKQACRKLHNYRGLYHRLVLVYQERRRQLSKLLKRILKIV